MFRVNVIFHFSHTGYIMLYYINSHNDHKIIFSLFNFKMTVKIFHSLYFMYFVETYVNIIKYPYINNRSKS